MARPQRFPAERDIDSLLATYRQAQRTIIAQIKLAVREADQGLLSRRRSQLASVVATLHELGVETDPAARRIVADLFRQASERAARQTAAVGVAGPLDSSFAGVSREAVVALQDSVVDRLSTARQTIGRQAADVFARTQRRSTMLALLGAEGSPRAASRQLRDTLVRQGQTAFVDRAGKRWALDAYADMAIRTVTRETVVQGAVTRMAAHGVDLARVTVHASSCQICKPWEGRLLSLDGSTDSYLGEAVADGPFPPFHPNAVMEGTRVEPVGHLRGAVRARWDGPLVHLATAGGVDLAIGPNHPVLTSRGWLAAKLLRHGDHVIRRVGTKGMGTPTGPAMSVTRALGTEDHLDHGPPFVQEVFDALAATGLSARVPASPDYLHGDGNFCQGEVDVVRADRLLRDVGEPTLTEPCSAEVLVGAGVETSRFAGGGAAGTDLGAVGGSVGGALADIDAAFAESPQQGCAADWAFEREHLGGLAVEVAVDEIVEIRDVDRFVGHAFDLETASETYFADRLFVHNCRHTISPVAVRVEAIERQLQGA